MRNVLGSGSGEVVCKCKPALQQDFPPVDRSPPTRSTNSHVVHSLLSVVCVHHLVTVFIFLCCAVASTTSPIRLPCRRREAPPAAERLLSSQVGHSLLLRPPLTRKRAGSNFEEGNVRCRVNTTLVSPCSLLVRFLLCSTSSVVAPHTRSMIK